MFYFDTSFIAPLILPESASQRIEAFMQKLPVGELAISRWTKVEFASLLNRRVHNQDLTEEEANRALAVFEQLVSNSYQVITPSAEDFDLAAQLLGKFCAGLRSGDALHLAVARNHNAETFYTLDKRLLRTAATLKFSASMGI